MEQPDPITTSEGGADDAAHTQSAEHRDGPTHVADDRRQHGHAHSHAPSPDADRRLLTLALGLILGFMAAEVIVAFSVQSLALLADAGHMLTDAAALGAALWALHLSTKPARGSWTFGFQRAEILSAAANGVSLLVVGGIVLVEAIRRLIEPAAVGGVAVLVVALAGAVVNVLATILLARANRQNLNIAGAYAHILTDLYSFLATAVAAIVIITVGFTRADSIASLVVVALMIKAAWSLLNASGRVLLERAPDGVDLIEVREHLLATEHVTDVHDLHAWTVTSALPALSAHVVVSDECFVDGHAPALLDRLQACLGGHFDLEHSTFQLEPAGHLGHETGTH